MKEDELGIEPTTCKSQAQHLLPCHHAMQCDVATVLLFQTVKRGFRRQKVALILFCDKY